MREMEFKLSFFTSVLTYLSWGLLNILFYNFIYRHVDNVAGWDISSVYILIATYLIVKTTLQTLFQRNLREINGLVINGGLDLVLVKPVSSQFYVSLRKTTPQGIVRIIFALAVLYIVTKRGGFYVSLYTSLLFTLFIILAVLIFYSLWFTAVSLVFWLGRVNNIAYLSRPLFSFAKMPVDAYPRKVTFLLTFVIPVVFVTTIPAKILLGNFEIYWLISGFFVALFLLLLTQKFWETSLRRYSSAGG